MMADFRRQAERFGAEFITDDVTRVDFSERPFRVFVGNDEHRADSVIVATGASARQLGLAVRANASRAAASPTARPATARSSATRSSWSSAAATRRWRRRPSSPDSRARS